MSYATKIEAHYKVTAGFFSWVCPYCNVQIMSTHDHVHKDWRTATVINKANETVTGFHNGYGEVGGMDVYVFSMLPDTEYYKIVKEHEAKDIDDENCENPEAWIEDHWKELRHDGLDKEVPIKIYHDYCYKQAGSPNYVKAKKSKNDREQGIPNEEMKKTAQKPIKTYLENRGIQMKERKLP